MRKWNHEELCHSCFWATSIFVTLCIMHNMWAFLYPGFSGFVIVHFEHLSRLLQADHGLHSDLESNYHLGVSDLYKVLWLVISYNIKSLFWRCAWKSPVVLYLSFMQALWVAYHGKKICSSWTPLGSFYKIRWANYRRSIVPTLRII